MSDASGIGRDLLGTLAVGGGAAALLYALMHAARAAGRPLPRWLLPAGIGLSMIAFATWNEYSWAARVKAQLPDRVAILAEGQVSSPLRPWTYLSAPTTRLALLDPQAPVGSLALKLSTQGSVSSSDVGADLSLSCDACIAVSGASGNIRLF